MPKPINHEKIASLLDKASFQSIQEANEFYFQIGQDKLLEWKNGELSPKLQAELQESLSLEYEQIQEKGRQDPAFQKVLNLLLEIITYCDTKGKDKQTLNQYPDKRALANAFVNMQYWLNHLLLFKLQPNQVPDGSTKNAFAYLLDPVNHLTVLSEKHRQLIARNLLENPYDPEAFTEQVKTHFQEVDIACQDQRNYSYLLSELLYALRTEWDADYANKANGGKGKQERTFETIKAQLEAQGDFRTYMHYVQKMLQELGVHAPDPRIVWSLRDGRLNLVIGQRYCFNAYLNDPRGTFGVISAQPLTEDSTPFEGSQEAYYTYFKDFDPDATAWASIIAGLQAELNRTRKSGFTRYNDPDFEQYVFGESQSTQSVSMNHPLNQILYGPPGTGKTYRIAELTAQICGVDTSGLSRAEIKRAYNELIKEKRVVFTTFHQSMTYEDFVEGIKPVIDETNEEDGNIAYRIEDGLFKQAAIRAAFAMIEADTPEEARETLQFADQYEQYRQYLENRLDTDKEVVLPTRSGGQIRVTSLSRHGNLNLQHLNGDREYTVSRNRLSKLDKALPDLEEVNNINDQFREVIGGSNSSAYWAVLNAIRQHTTQTPPVKTDSATRTYEQQKETVEVTPLDKFSGTGAKPYVLVIDEINRGNVANIFGELITLLEADKRLGQAEALQAELPYSKQAFGVPANLYIIGTMNTADRSVEALDAALRRRFNFLEVYPQPELLNQFNPLFAERLELDTLLATINDRLERLLDRDHTIGHASFMQLRQAGNEDEALQILREVFDQKLLPQLREYFYGDFAKIGLVLGEAFVQVVSSGDLAFAKTFPDEADDFGERPVYRFTKPDSWSLDDFRSVYD